ncbi:CHRD domain-containing protein [Fibrella aestuarina BUZ 2]|uniref:CHRD domain-containing protein n=1 Tax=Fibrella aestuarina BUZ 2 TaxID=1166018 RepID=I0KGL0_9BACT|nr:CHRD domain-containing protein [Fibrella aestuarina]CCH03263.1 CHRD domain-containing protein [Fibrella aestuarina BUZ 2]
MTRSRHYRFLYILLSSILGIALVACDHRIDLPADAQVRLVANLSGSAERPSPVNSPGTGTFVGILDRSTRVLSYTLTYTGITPTAGHLHRITPNSPTLTGPVEIPFAALGSPIIGTAILASQGRADSLIRGFYYANLHTPANPAGEIRGNIRVDGPVKLSAVLNGASEKPTPTPSAATGTFAGVLDPATRVLSYTVTYAGITPSAGHLHRITPNSPTGVGPVEIPFAALSSPIIGITTLTTATRVDSMLNGFYYANLHTPIYPAGEIRGDIKPF